MPEHALNKTGQDKTGQDRTTQDRCKLCCKVTRSVAVKGEVHTAEPCQSMQRTMFGACAGHSDHSSRRPGGLSLRGENHGGHHMSACMPCGRWCAASLPHLKLHNRVVTGLFYLFALADHWARSSWSDRYIMLELRQVSCPSSLHTRGAVAVHCLHLVQHIQ